MSKLIYGSVAIATLAAVSLLMAGVLQSHAGEATLGGNPSTSVQVSTMHFPSVVAPRVTDNDDINRSIDEANALFWSAFAAGGLEMQGAGFHPFPGVDGDIATYGVDFARFDLQGQLIGADQALVSLRRDEVLSLGVEDTYVIESLAHPGSWDVMARFSPAIAPYAKDRQLAREFALSNNWQPLDEGVALVHQNFIYGCYTYGEIHAAMSANMGWATVVKGTDINTANNIAAALLP